MEETTLKVPTTLLEKVKKLGTLYGELVEQGYEDESNQILDDYQDELDKLVEIILK